MKSLTLLLILLASTSSWAQSSKQMSIAKKVYALNNNILIAQVACATSSGGTLITALLNTLPMAGAIPNVVVGKIYGDQDTESLATFGGGAIFGFVEGLTYGMSFLTDDDSRQFVNTQYAYQSTVTVAKQSFGPDSQCYKSIKKIGALLTLEK